ncbi:fatty acid synthase alpha subunit Lsd1 [Coemansia sp. RSA 2559]|nr:fatty acid synthase alpha subunit Lsd1 [Coemansia sp. RSA 2559]
MTKNKVVLQDTSCLEEVKLVVNGGDAVLTLEFTLPRIAVAEVEALFKSFTNTLLVSGKQADIALIKPEQIDDVVVSARFIEYAATIPTASKETSAALFAAFNARFCPTQNIHASICDQGLGEERVQAVLRSYYAAQEKCVGSESQQQQRQRQAIPALFSSAEIKPVGIFRGQGGMDNYIDETRAIYRTYRPLVEAFVEQMNAFLVEESADPHVSSMYKHGLDVLGWITSPNEALPDAEYLISVPVSIPVVGLTQLMHIVVLYKTLGMTPGELAASFKGTYRARRT